MITREGADYLGWCIYWSWALTPHNPEWLPWLARNGDWDRGRH